MNTEEFAKKFNKIQPIIGCIVILFLVWFSFKLHVPKLIFGLLIGLGFGYTLTRSRFGFAGGIKRIYVRGEGSLTKALLITFAAVTLIYGAIQWTASTKGAIPAFLAKNGEAIIPGTQNVFMTNIGTVLGGFLFGIGMIIAGGCASGTLADFGEGEGHAMIAFPLFILGTIPGHYLREVIDRNPIGKVRVRIHFPQYVGYLGAIILTFVGLLFLYILTKAYENKRKKEGTYLDPKSDYEDFEKELKDNLDVSPWGSALYHKVFVERWSFKTGALILSIISGCYIIFTNKAWGVTSAFTHIAVWFLGLFGVHFDDKAFDSVYKAISNGILADAGVLLDIGIVVGSFLAFLMAGRFKLNFKFNSKNAFLFGLGGLLMGFGSRLAKGCNIGALYSSLPNFSISGWVFLVAISLGAVVGLKLFKGSSCLIPPRHRDVRDFK
ncbi:YeeE/YedE family protein [Gemella bergeri]